MHVLCRRCLLKDMESEKPLYALIQEVIAAIDPADRADAEAYRVRLNACKMCDKLTGGMCALCGCYVESRAAKRKQSCPDAIDHWAKK